MKIEENRKLKILSRSAGFLENVDGERINEQQEPNESQIGLTQYQTNDFKGKNEIEEGQGNIPPFKEKRLSLKRSSTLAVSPMKRSTTTMPKNSETKIGSTLPSKTFAKTDIDLMPEFQSLQDDTDSGKVFSLKGYFDTNN